MTLNDLIDQLEALREEIGSSLGLDTEQAGDAIAVRAVTQPNYPMVGEIVNLMGATFLDRNDESETTDDAAYTVYLGIDDGSEYGSKWMFDHDGYTISVCADCENIEQECDCEDDDQ